MSDTTFSKEQTQQLVFNAEIKKDIEFIKDAIVALQKTVSDYANQFVSKVEFSASQVETEKVHTDFEKRLRFLERYAWLAIGAIGVVQIVLEVWLNYHG